ncbi:protein-tyrosine phosphatase family protein [Herbidospora mongoliensis]|uniref:protein-tyrosine phosphatase family protein n=1 Tax=Herbidospora mongoliensis TaxID=688067 RepID=UPI000834B6FF|nr:dual specificity protein phosphatase family protein [Herbidospora mongoliensis]
MDYRFTGVPYAEEPWHEIIPGLFMGGHFRDGLSEGLLPVVVADEFDVVVSMIRLDGHGPSGSIPHHVCHVPDGRLTSVEVGTVVTMAGFAAEAIRSDLRVLVRCRAGYNRSGLVVAQTLLLLGYALDDAIDLIRSRRSLFALHNSHFVEYLTTGLAQIRDE